LSLRGSKFVITLLLLISVILLSAQQYFPATQVAAAAPIITVSPSKGPTGQFVNVKGSGFTSGASGDTCSISGSVVNIQACSVGSSTTPGGNFTVANVAPGPYLVTLTHTIAASGTTEQAQAIFTVISPVIFVSGTGVAGSFKAAGQGPPGAIVYVEGMNFSFTDTSCSFSSSSSVVTSSSCVKTGGSYGLNGTFFVGNVAPGSYLVQVTGSPLSDFAQANFVVNVTGPRIGLNPSKGVPGTQVQVFQSRGNMTLFPNTDVTCSVNGDNSIIRSSSCVINSVSGTSFASVNGTIFTVNNVAPGAYRVWVHGDQSGFNAYATFTVLPPPTLRLDPSIGIPGTTVKLNVTGSLFPSTDTYCSISGSGSVIASSSCIVVNDVYQGVIGKNITGSSFVVANVAQGPYTITVTASPSGISISATFTVSNPFTPTIIAIPSDGPRGTLVTVQGTGFSSSDVSCQLSSLNAGTTHNDTFLITSPSCSISGSTVSASFTVGQGAIVHNGPTNLNVTGNTGDKAGTTFKVDAQPVIAFSLNSALGNPTIASANPGQTIYVRLQPTPGTPATGKFSSGDSSSCTLTSNPSGLFSTSACIIQNSGTLLNGTVFQISGNANGAYTITVTGSLGDTASATFFVTVLNTLVIFPTNATTGATVNFRATGFYVSDTGCVLQSFNYPIHGPLTPNNNLFSSSTCSITSPQVAQGSFVVGPFATTNINWTLQVRGTPGNDLIPSAQPFTVFNVTASVAVSPSSGTIGSVFSFNGSGFSSAATSCIGSFHPSLGSGSQLLSSTANCGIASPNLGQISGSFVAPGNTVPGVYVLNVGDRLGHNASASFTIGTPTAQVTIAPNFVTQPSGAATVSVGLSGSGFNGNDTTCTITTGSAAITYSSSCIISGGFVSASLTVSSSVTPGLYLITVTGTGLGSTYHDFASNYLAVGTVTTATTFTTTTSISPTATSTTTYTTTTSVSLSLTSSTLTITGPSTIVFQQGTQTTVSGVTTITATTVTYTGFPSPTLTTTTTKTVTLGQAIGPSIADELGLLGLLLLAMPSLLRRLFG
jgi:hypothetical protein